MTTTINASTTSATVPASASASQDPHCRACGQPSTPPVDNCTLPVDKCTLGGDQVATKKSGRHPDLSLTYQRLVAVGNLMGGDHYSGRHPDLSLIYQHLPLSRWQPNVKTGSYRRHNKKWAKTPRKLPDNTLCTESAANIPKIDLVATQHRLNVDNKPFQRVATKYLVATHTPAQIPANRASTTISAGGNQNIWSPPGRHLQCAPSVHRLWITSRPKNTTRGQHQ